MSTPAYEIVKLFDFQTLPREVKDSILACFAADDRHFTNGGYASWDIAEVPGQIADQWFCDNGAEPEERILIHIWW